MADQKKKPAMTRESFIRHRIRDFLNKQSDVKPQRGEKTDSTKTRDYFGEIHEKCDGQLKM